MAALLAVLTLAGTQQVSWARPSHADLEAARARLNALNEQMDVLVEDYDQAQLRLSDAENSLQDARQQANRARAQARAANRELGQRASLAYQGVGSELEVLLGSSSIAEFSDRLEFLNQLAGTDADAVSRASVTGQRARWAGEDLARAVRARQQVVQQLAQKKAEISNTISTQRSLIARLERVLSRPVYTPQSPQAPPSLSSGTPAPAVDSAQVQAVLAAAYSVIGTPYVYAGSSPETGFDCSGFTMWAWAHGGVSLPHSSAMQYSVLPHVDRSDLQPGDLLFFYSPIHHVTIYVGGGRMIHSPHTGGYVEVVPVYWEYFSGAARPS